MLVFDSHTSVRRDLHYVLDIETGVSISSVGHTSPWEFHVTSSIALKRSDAFKRQKGLCHYCNQPMTLSNGGRAINRCTAEHLIPRSEGGGNNRHNIVAACAYCNQQRHKCPSKALAHHKYKALVKQSVQNGNWPTAAHPAASISPEIAAEPRYPWY
jgi:hypothetical protein